MPEKYFGCTRCVILTLWGGLSQHFVPHWLQGHSTARLTSPTIWKASGIVLLNFPNYIDINTTLVQILSLSSPSTGCNERCWWSVKGRVPPIGNADIQEVSKWLGNPNGNGKLCLFTPTFLHCWLWIIYLFPHCGCVPLSLEFLCCGCCCIWCHCPLHLCTVCPCSWMLSLPLSSLLTMRLYSYVHVLLFL